MINVVCVLRTGGDYTAEDVHRLQAGVAQHLTLPHRFACFSDADVPCHRVELTSDWPGWWAKMEVFRPDVVGDLLYFDLDTVVSGSLDAIATTDKFTILRDFYQGGDNHQSSAMFLPEQTRRIVWNAWNRDPQGHMARYEGGGDQKFLQGLKLGPVFWQDAFPNKFVSYKVHVRHPHQNLRETGNGSIPPEASVVIFHGKPRPRDVGWLQSEQRRSCLVLGGAASLWDDVEAALDLGEFDGVIATNDAGAVWKGPLTAWATLHPEKLPNWKREREASGYPMEFQAWSNRSDRSIDRVTHNWHGSSGLFAVKVARELGFDRIVLCGVPMNAAGAHFFDEKPWVDVKSYTAGWHKHREVIAPFVRSMGGWTQELLGAPTPEWLTT